MKETDRLALALSWDGTRQPLRSLPPKARAFLATPGKSPRPPDAKKTATLLADDAVNEIRVCWVPRLTGGGEVLSSPFPLQHRLAFRAVRTQQFGNILGVVYRRSK